MKSSYIINIALALTIIVSWVPSVYAAAQAAGAGASSAQKASTWTSWFRFLKAWLEPSPAEFLHRAIVKNDDQEVIRLLKKGVSPQAHDRNGFTPLETAVGQWEKACEENLPLNKRYERLPAIFNALIMHGADVGQRVSYYKNGKELRTAAIGHEMLELRYGVKSVQGAPLSPSSEGYRAFFTPDRERVYCALNRLSTIVLNSLNAKNLHLACQQGQALQECICKALTRDKNSTQSILPKELIALIASYHCYLNASDEYWLEQARAKRDSLMMDAAVQAVGK